MLKQLNTLVGIVAVDNGGREEPFDGPEASKDKAIAPR